MRNRIIIGSLALLAAACGVALAQNYGPRSGSVAWDYKIDGGFAQGAWNPQIQDGGFFDGGPQEVCCGTYNTYGPWTCNYVWVDAGYDYGSGESRDGGFYDAGCTDAGIFIATLDAGPFDAGIKIFQNPYYQQDAGYGDGGYVAVPQVGYTWLPITAAIYNGTVYAEVIPFGGFTTAAGCSVYVTYNGGTNGSVAGHLCLSEGFPGSTPQTGSWYDAGCLLLDGGPGPFQFPNVGPIDYPALLISYVSSAGDDAGYLVGQFNITNY
jgi:hypothetical protein